MNTIWHNTSEDIPQAIGEYSNKNYPQIPCLCQTEYGVQILCWNVCEQCWDDEDADDYHCDINGVEKWAYIDEIVNL